MKRIFSLVTSLLVVGTGLDASPAAAQAPVCSHRPDAYTGGPGGTGVDPLTDRQWGLEQINARDAWAKGATGRGATVALLDTGIDLTHPEFAGRVLPGVDLLKLEDCPGPQDESGHGTGAAGIIAAGSGNGIGVAGVAPEANVLPVRVWKAPNEAPNWDALAQGLRYAADGGADVISISIFTNVREAGDETGESELAQALDYAWEKGAVVIANAGNNARPYCGFPARAPNVVCVAATDHNGQPASYSHMPVHPNGVGLRAPGAERTPDEHASSNLPPPAGGALPRTCERDNAIWLTLWPGSIADCPEAYRGYDTGVGGSWGPPHVAGVAALLAGEGLDNARIVECLQTTSSNNGAYDPVMGYGIVDAGAAVSTCVKETGSVDESPFAASVVLPQGYETSSRSYPVLYLIPTIANEECDDASCPRLKPFLDLLADRQVITVLPHGGGLSQFTDWRGDGPKNQTTFTEQLVPFIDANYRTVPDRGHRAIAGISAGGYAAFLNASKRPDLFSAAASFSGVMDIVADDDDRPGGPGFFSGSEPVFDSLDGAEPHAVWGDPATQEIWWRNSNPEDLASNLRGVSLFRTSGDGLPCEPDEANPGSGIQVAIESFVHDMNLNYTATIDQTGIPHEYHERCGTHNGFAEGWWSEDFRKWLDEGLRFGGAPPGSFDYKSANRTFTVWDWSFAAEEARAAEFLYVTDAGLHGLTLTGSGKVSVETPRFVRGNGPVDVLVGDKAFTVGPEQGRLRFDVSLGPPHALQQYSAEQRTAEAAGDYFVTEEIRFMIPRGRQAVDGRPTSEGGTSRLPGPRLAMKVSDRTPERGASITFRPRLRRCAGHARTRMELQERADGRFRTIVTKRLNARCTARFRMKASFSERSFRAFWPSQDDDHRAGRSRPKRVKTR